jgi:SAM-dependent methyltransferase
MNDTANEKSPGTPPDWQLPTGVDRSLWDYLHSPELAAKYDAGLAGSSLFHLDIAFVREHCPAPGRLLDLGCGTARLLRELTPLGYTSTGIDLSPEMLAVARRKADEVGLNLELLEANLTDLHLLSDGSFDFAACLFSTLGMVRGRDNRTAALREAWRVLRQGGIFVLHVHNRWWRLHDRAGRGWLLADLLGWRERDLEPGDHRMPTHQGIAGLVLHLFTRSEILRELRRAGFTIREVRPISLAADGRLSAPWWFPSCRAYGFLIAAVK